MTRPIIATTRALPGSLSVSHAEIRMGPNEKPSREWILNHIRGAHYIVTMFSDKVDAEFLDAAGPQLKGVSNFAVGYDNINLAECTKRGVQATNSPNAVTEGTADLAWLLVLAVARRLVEADRFVRGGDWGKAGLLSMTDFMGMDLTGKTLLVVGAGRIGYGLASRSLAWGMKVLYTARSQHWEFELAPMAGKRVSLEDGLRQADVVSIHTPLTAETKHLINRERLALLKPTAILVNTARGPVVDEDALADALIAKKLFGAGLDVFEREPTINPKLLGLMNVTMTPHIGSAELRFREAMTAMVSDNISAMIAGKKPPNLLHA